MTFKGLDPMLHLICDRTGNPQQLPLTSTKLDMTIKPLLGISKAILDYMVFCHEDESSWFFMERAFPKTHYNKIFIARTIRKALFASRSHSRRHNTKQRS